MGSVTSVQWLVLSRLSEPQRLKPRRLKSSFSARLKSCPDTNRKFVPPASPAPSARSRCAPSAAKAELKRGGYRSAEALRHQRQVQQKIFPIAQLAVSSRMLCGLSPGLNGSCFLYLHSSDAVAFYFCDCITVAFVFERIAQAGNPLQMGENESTQSFKASIPGKS